MTRIFKIARWSLLLVLGFTPLVTTEARATDFDWEHFFYDAPSGIYDVNAKQWNIRGMAILGAGAVATLATFHFGEPYGRGEATPNWLGDFNTTINDYGNVAVVSVPFFFWGAGLLMDPASPARRQTLGSAEEMLESLVFAGGSALVLKETVERGRPNLNGDHSFPSAHTALAFSAAGILFERYPWYIGIPSLGAAALVGFSRVDAGDHYLSDVVAGATLGLFWAEAVHFYHTNLDSKPTTSQAALLPWVDGNNQGMLWTQRF